MALTLARHTGEVTRPGLALLTHFRQGGLLPVTATIEVWKLFRKHMNSRNIFRKYIAQIAGSTNAVMRSLCSREVAKVWQKEKLPTILV